MRSFNSNHTLGFKRMLGTCGNYLIVDITEPLFHNSDKGGGICCIAAVERKTLDINSQLKKEWLDK